MEQSLTRDGSVHDGRYTNPFAFGDVFCTQMRLILLEM